MTNRIAICSIIVEDRTQITKLNSLLSDYSEFIVGRMGIPYQKYAVSIISIVLDAHQEIISALSGKIGRLEGITTKTIYSKQSFAEEGTAK